MDYKSAGVDIEAGYRSVELIKEYVKRTRRPEVMTGLGDFSGAFSLASFSGMECPVLISGTDGVGTKLKLAFLTGRHDTVGIDCVAMCVNDIICCGAQPLFFLDYIACGKNVPEKIAQIVKGVAKGCEQAGAALIGGETAEMPGFYPEDEYDLAGFAVGIVDEKERLGPHRLHGDEALIGLASTGIHSNGFSLVRKIFPMTGQAMETFEPALNMTLGEALLAPTKIYVGAVRQVMTGGIHVRSISHITGGGFYENIPRMLGEGMRAVVKTDSYVLPPVFALLEEKGEMERAHMYSTFNMGIGMVMAVPAKEAQQTVELLAKAGQEAWVIGHIEPGEKGVTLC